MCEACGYRVKAAEKNPDHEHSAGGYEAGKVREITGEELEQLQRDTGMLNRN